MLMSESGASSKPRVEQSIEAAKLGGEFLALTQCSSLVLFKQLFVSRAHVRRLRAIAPQQDVMGNFGNRQRGKRMRSTGPGNEEPERQPFQYYCVARPRRNFGQNNGSIASRSLSNTLTAALLSSWRFELLPSSLEHAMTNHPKEQTRDDGRKDDKDKRADDDAPDPDAGSPTPDSAAPIPELEDDELCDEDAPE
jgi:hypothetical protein